MISENQKARQATLEYELRSLLYRRLLLEREKEIIDQRIGQIEGALNENEAAGRDIGTQAAIDQAKAEAEAVKDGG